MKLLQTLRNFLNRFDNAAGSNAGEAAVRTARPAQQQARPVARTEEIEQSPIIIRPSAAAPKEPPQQVLSVAKKRATSASTLRSPPASRASLPRPSKQDLCSAAELDTQPALKPLLAHFLSSAHQLRQGLPEVVKAILQQQGVPLEEQRLRSFEGNYLVRLSLSGQVAVAEDSVQEVAAIKAMIALLPVLLGNQPLVQRALGHLEKEKPSLPHLLQYHLLLTGVLPLLRVKRQPPGLFEVEFRAHSVVQQTLQRGAILGNWISENLQDAYLRGSRDALIRLIAAKEKAAISRPALLQWLGGATLSAATRTRAAKVASEA